MSNALTAPVGVKEVTLQPPLVGVLEMVQRAASDASFDPTKFQTLVEFCRAERDRSCREAFNAAMVACQAEMRPIEADATNPQTRSRYASYPKLDKAMRPIYNKHGFSLSFNSTESPIAECARVLCYVAHCSGYSVTYQIDIPIDGKGIKGNDAMTRTHATAAGISYAMRYLLKMIFNVLVGEDDTDGNVGTAAVVAPEGFNDWWDDLGAAVDEGLAAYQAAWKSGTKAQQAHLAKHFSREHEDRKKRAAKVAR